MKRANRSMLSDGKGPVGHGQRLWCVVAFVVCGFETPHPSVPVRKRINIAH